MGTATKGKTASFSILPVVRRLSALAFSQVSFRACRQLPRLCFRSVGIAHRDCLD